LIRRLRTAGLAITLMGTAAIPAVAQVTVNPGALDLLPSKPANRAPPAHTGTAHHTAPAKKPVGTKPGDTKPAGAATNPTAPAAAPAAGAAAAAAAPAKPALPATPPAIAALPPAAPVPAPRPQPAPVVPVAADAPGQATPIPGGVRVTFGPGRQDLNPATEAALRALAQTLKPQDTTTINVFAYAPGPADDPSVARRLSLARALAARAVLITEGIASTRIYPRAMGAAPEKPAMGAAPEKPAMGAAPDEPDPDRVDVVAGTPGPPASASPPTLPADPAAAPKARTK
jgi:outer membrane protein OmpA-like peptidoglycan-associated protein